MRITERFYVAEQGGYQRVEAATPTTVVLEKATPSTPNPTVPTSGLLQLPAEIRNLIYEHAFASDNGVIEVTKTNIHIRTPLLQTCRQIREEATDVLLRCFRFRIICGAGKGVPAVKWLESLGPKTMRIRYYEIAFDAACQLRYHFAAARRYAVLEAVSRRVTQRFRNQGYEKSYALFVADYGALVRLLRKRGQSVYLHRKTGPMAWKLCAPPQRFRAQLDEYVFMDRIEELLRNGGFTD